MSSPRAVPWPILLVALVYPTILTWLYFVRLAGHEVWLQRTTYGVGKLLQFGLPLAWAFVAARGAFAARWPNRRELAWGLGSGLVILAAMLGLFAALQTQAAFAAAADQVRSKILDMRLHSVALYCGMGVFYSLLHSLLEEFYWRWFVYGGLRKWLPVVPAIAVSSLGFMAHHVIVLATYFGWDGPLSYLFAVAVAIGGAFWAWLYERSGSLVAPWLSHLVVDAAIFLIGYQMVRAILQ